MGNTRPLGAASSRSTAAAAWCSHCGATGLATPTPSGSGSSVWCAFCHRPTRIERQRQRGAGDSATPTTVALAVTSPPLTLSARREIPPDYPKIRGRKRALLVGVSYTGTAHELRGTVNDVKEMRRLLVAQFGFPSGCILELTGNQNPVSFVRRRFF